MPQALYNHGSRKNFSTEMKPEEKFSLLEKEYGPVEENLEKGVKATKMILAGKSDEEIMKSTDLTKEQLEKLKKTST